jgi:REP element-mobilizing transposase RayT
MKTSGGLQHRRAIRLPDIDGVVDATWFVTLCAFQKAHIFGRITEDRVELSAIGRIVAEEWVRTPAIRPEVVLDEWVVMPNHLHAIVFVPGGRPTEVRDARRASLRRPARSLASLIGGFKASVTRRARIALDDPAYRVWQDRYYEHAIRTQRELEQIRTYIHENPARWNCDSDS